MKYGIALLSLFAIMACKKKETEQPLVTTKQPLIAPCALEENVLYSGYQSTDTISYDGDSISTTPDINLINCHYFIHKKGDYDMRLYFQNEPQTGYYITTYGNSLEYENNVILKNECASFTITTYYADTLYVNNEDGIITISFCDLGVTLDEELQAQSWISGLITVEK